MASYIYCVVGLDKLLHPRIQDSNITLTEVHSQATGKEIYFQTWAGIKKKRGISSQMGSWAVWVRVCVCVYPTEL